MTHGSGIATDAPIFSARSKIVFTGVEASGSARTWSRLVSRTTVNLRPAAGSSVRIAPTTRSHLEGVATLAHRAQVGTSWRRRAERHHRAAIPGVAHRHV